MQSNGKVVTLAPRLGWRDAVAHLRAEPEHSRIVGGSLIMLVGYSLVSIVNFGYNVAVARLLGPAAFGHAAAAITLLMLVSAITLSFQLVCAKFVARNETPGARSAVYSQLLRRAWRVGAVLGAVLVLASGPVAAYLRIPSPTPVAILGVGIAFYVPLGVRRGGMQGTCTFPRLSANFIIEALVKFGAALLLIRLGYGVVGAVAAISASVVLAYLLPPTISELRAKPEPVLRAEFGEGLQAIVFFVGQVVINNIDILLVKHFFAPALAGLYAAIALVGRVLFFASWSVVSAMFPISAKNRVRDESVSVVAIPLLLVLSLSVVFIVAMGLFPETVLHFVFGSTFRQAGHGMDSLLSLYAAATGAYALSVVLIAYEMSRRIANTGWLQMAFSGVIVLGIALFHSTLRQVVVVQLVVMVLMLIAVSLPFFRPQPRSATLAGTATEPASPMKKLRRVTEAEVIAEFLKNEFYQPEFHHDRERFEHLVMRGDILSEGENALRRALLFRRRGTMWRELPSDTQWWEVQIEPEDIGRMRVFERAQWRRIASGSFFISDVVERIRAQQAVGRNDAFIERIHSLSQYLRLENHTSSVILIGIDERRPVTILEGNHRLTAALLASPTLMRTRFRFFCGLTPRMNECCWYRTDLPNVWRYAQNRLKYLLYDKEADVERVARANRDLLAAASGYEKPMSAGPAMPEP